MSAISMLAWPEEVTPITGLPTIPATAPAPAAYFALVEKGQWPRQFFCPTKEPTSESLTGVSIHALAAVGPKMVSPLPAHLLPFAKTGAQYWCFDLNTPGPAIRYVDWEVDQWLTVAPDWPGFLAQLTWQPPLLPPAPSPQEFAHAALVCDAAALPALLDFARTALSAETYGQWLVHWVKQPGLAALTRTEIAFARQYRWAEFSAPLKAQLSTLS